MKVNLQLIKNLRKRSAMSQEDMATLLGDKSRWAYWRRENGEVPFTAEQLYIVANHFKVSLESLYVHDFAKNVNVEVITDEENGTETKNAASC